MASTHAILVVGEAAQAGLFPSTLEAIAAARTLGGGGVGLLLFGPGVEAAASVAIRHGADAVHTVDAVVTVEETVDLVVEAVRRFEPGIVLGAKEFAGGAMPRVGFRLGTALVQDCTKVVLDADGRLVGTRPVYGGSAVATVRCGSAPAVASLRGRAYEALPADAGRTGEVTPFEAEHAADPRVRVVERTERQAEGVRLEDARIIVGGGRGLGGPEPFAQLEALASLLHGTVGASRAACDAGWVPSSYQIGLTGKSVAPDLYIAIGISGASQHLAGLSGARDIVAINKDASANIFKEARFGVAGDWQQVLPAFIDQLHELIDERPEGG